MFVPAAVAILVAVENSPCAWSGIVSAAHLYAGCTVKDVNTHVRRAVAGDVPSLIELWYSWIEAKRGTRGFSELYENRAAEIEWPRLLEEHEILVVEEDGHLTAMAAMVTESRDKGVVKLCPFAYEEAHDAVLLLTAATNAARDAGASRVEYEALAGDRIFKAVGEETGFKGAFVLLSHLL